MDSTTIQTALSLLGIGMITVFLVLFLVVQTGNILIGVVNRFVPDKPVTVKSAQLDQEEVAAITAAVEIFTMGKGRITNIERKN